MDLSKFAVTQEEFDFEIDGSIYQLKALNADLYASVEMFVSGMSSGMLNYRQKENFVRSNIIGWSKVSGLDGKELKFSEESKLVMMNPDLDGFLNLLILQCYRKRRETIEKLEEDKETVGKS